MSRIATFFHGTTLTRAQQIAGAAEFAVQQTFLALGQSNRDLAVIFANRAVSRHPGEGGPALVSITMEEPAFEALRRLKLIRMTGFDSEDQPALRLRTQWILEPGGVRQFNRDSEDWEWENA